MNYEISGDNLGGKVALGGGQTPALAVLALVASAALWGISWYPFRLLAASGVSGVWAIIATELIAAALCLVIFWPQIVRRREQDRQAPYLVVGSWLVGRRGGAALGVGRLDWSRGCLHPAFDW